MLIKNPQPDFNQTNPIIPIISAGLQIETLNSEILKPTASASRLVAGDNITNIKAVDRIIGTTCCSF